jgi:uncharacterized membrane protein
MNHEAHEEPQTRRGVIRSYKLKLDEKRSVTERLADSLTSKFGTILFLLVNILLFFGWILINLSTISFIAPFDPYPFNFLTMVVSLEAIILSIVVLISQNRDTKIANVRAEIDTRIDIIAEEEITKILELIKKLLEKNNIDISKDEALTHMLKPTDRDYMEKKFENEV